MSKPLTFDEYKETLTKKTLKMLDRMLFIKQTALNKKDPKCKAGWKGTDYCNPKLRKQEIKRVNKEMKKSIGQLKNEIQAITDEIHDREELTAEELEAKKNREQPTLKF